MSQKMCQVSVTLMQLIYILTFSETLTSNCSTFNETIYMEHARLLTPTNRQL